MRSVEETQYLNSLTAYAASVKETCAEGSPAYWKHILTSLSSNLSWPALSEKLLTQAVKENDFAGLQRVFYHRVKLSLLPSSGGYDHCARFWPLLDLLACADTDQIDRILPEGLPLSANGYPMYIHGTNLLLCLLYNTGDTPVYAKDSVVAKAEKFTSSKKPIWERAVISCLLAVLEHDTARFSESLQNVCAGYPRIDAAPCQKLQCQNAYGLLMLARRFWTPEEFASVSLPEHKNFSKGYAKWLFAQDKLPDDLCVTYDPPLTRLNTILQKPAAVTRIHQKYLGAENPYLSAAEKKAWYLDPNKMMEELLDAAPGTFGKADNSPDNSTPSQDGKRMDAGRKENARDSLIKDGLSEEDLKKLQRYIGHNTEERPTKEIIAHIEAVNAKTPLTKGNWEKLLFPACGNQNTELLSYLLLRIGGDIADIGQYMEHAVMGQEKRKDYLAKRIGILKQLMPYLPEKEKTAVLSETMLSAAWYGETEIVRFLAENGADLRYQDARGKDALAYAAQFREKFGDDTLYQYVYSLIGKKEPREEQKGTVLGRLKNLLFHSKKEAEEKGAGE